MVTWPWTNNNNVLATRKWQSCVSHLFVTTLWTIWARALSAADIPCSKELQGLCRSDGKRPDGLTLIPWQSGKSLLGRHSCLSFGRLLCCLSCPRSRFSSWVGSIQKRWTNIQAWQRTITFSRLWSRCLALLMSRPIIFLLSWRTKLANVLETSGRLRFYFSAFLFCCSDSTAFCFTICLLVRTARSNRMVAPTIAYINFSQIPRDPWYRVYKNDNKLLLINQ